MGEFLGQLRRRRWRRSADECRVISDPSYAAIHAAKSIDAPANDPAAPLRDSLTKSRQIATVKYLRTEIYCYKKVEFWRSLSLQPEGRISVLLSSASSGGTIAAARCLGASGYDVGIMYDSVLSAAAWSRYAGRTYSTPREMDSEAFLACLMAIGAKRPGQVLLPTSDETAWLYAEEAATLSSRFVIYQPPVETIRRILDKNELAAAASKVGIATPLAWMPADNNEVAELVNTPLPYPLLIKPRTHVRRRHNDKGILVYSREELETELNAFVQRENKISARGASEPAKWPLLQKFAQGGPGTISITGFIDRAGKYFVTRKCLKVLQRSEAIGVGVCFEAMPPDNYLSEAARELCREFDYFGMFEIEFVWADGHWVLIDFNPRLFNQVALDISREMALPKLVCLDAVGDAIGLRDAVAQAQAYDQSRPAVIRDGFTLRAILLAKALRDSAGGAERENWRMWLKKTAPHAVDIVADRTDWVPAVVHALSETYLGIRAFPKFLSTRALPTASATAERAT